MGGGAVIDLGLRSRVFSELRVLGSVVYVRSYSNKGLENSMQSTFIVIAHLMTSYSRGTPIDVYTSAIP